MYHDFAYGLSFLLLNQGELENKPPEVYTAQNWAATAYVQKSTINRPRSMFGPKIP